MLQKPLLEKPFAQLLAVIGLALFCFDWFFGWKQFIYAELILLYSCVWDLTTPGKVLRPNAHAWRVGSLLFFVGLVLLYAFGVYEVKAIAFWIFVPTGFLYGSYGLRKRFLRLRS